MKNWFNKNYKTIIISAFLIPIITVAIVSISHVTKWYGISNPFTWAVYLSIGVEIAALSALAAISADMGKKVYFPFGIVTLVQFIGNIYFAYSYIDISSQSFTSWVELVSPLLEYMGVEPTDMVGHKRFLAFFAGGMLPIISLSFLHMLVKFTQSDKNTVVEETVVKKSPEPVGEETPVVDAKDIVAEVSKVRLQQDELEILENYFNKMQKSNKDSETKNTNEEPQIGEENVYTPTPQEEEENNKLNDVFLIEDHLIGVQSSVEEPQPIIEEPIVEEQPIIEEPIVEEQPIIEEPIVEEQPIINDVVVEEPHPIEEQPILIESTIEEHQPIIEESVVQEPQPIEEPITEGIVEELQTEPSIEELPIEEEKKN